MSFFLEVCISGLSPIYIYIYIYVLGRIHHLAFRITNQYSDTGGSSVNSWKTALEIKTLCGEKKVCSEISCYLVVP